MLKIKKEVITQLTKHAQRDCPLEACGYLVGYQDIADEIIPMTNIDHSPIHYSLDPNEQFLVIKDVRKREKSIIALYHSHPISPAGMSAEDIRLAFDLNISYVIVSLVDNDRPIRAFQIKSQIVIEEELKVL